MASRDANCRGMLQLLHSVQVVLWNIYGMWKSVVLKWDDPINFLVGHRLHQYQVPLRARTSAPDKRAVGQDLP